MVNVVLRAKMCPVVAVCREDTELSVPKVVTCCALGVVMSLLVGCGLFSKKEGTTAAEQSSAPVSSVEHIKRPEVAVDVPWDTSARDNQQEPILKVALIGDESNPVPVPFLYGYPLYAGGDAARGILKLRHDSWTGVEQVDFEDETGVQRRSEHFPLLGCTIEGIKQDATTFIPLSLICELPPPDDLGGSKRPVVGSVKAGAREKAIIKEPSIRKAFFGNWHLKSTDFDTGNGEAYFNTDHGLLVFGFDGGRLARVGYYFHPPEKRWQAAMLWVNP